MMRFIEEEWIRGYAEAIYRGKVDKETMQRRFIEAEWIRKPCRGDLSRQSG